MCLLPLLAWTPEVRAEDPTLAGAWGGAPPPVTWTFVLETAGQARPVAAALLDPIARFVGELPADDKVEILAVHTRTTPMLEPRLITDATRSAVLDEIRTLETPSAKSSDLGAALAALTESVDRDAPTASHYVVVVGSFCHSPPLGSAYADGGYGCRSIIGLDNIDKAFDEAASKGLAGVLFPVDLPGSERSPVGIDAVTRVFNPSPLVQPAGTAAAWLDAQRGPALAELRAAAAARAERADLALRAEVTTAPTATNPRATLTVRSGLSHLGFDVTSLTVEGAGGAPGTLQLRPDATLDLDVPVPRAPFSILPAHDTVEIPVKLHLEGSLAPAAALRAAGVDPTTPAADLELAVRAERRYGLSAVQSAAVAVSLLILTVAGALVARRRTTPVRLGGTFTWRKGAGPRRPLAIEKRAEASVGIGADGALVESRREDAVLVLRVERLLWTDSISVEVRRAGVEINARPAAIGRHRVVAGATSFQFQDYRLSWE